MNTAQQHPFLSQFSKIVPIKTASLRYAVCGCCLCIKNANCYSSDESAKAQPAGRRATLYPVPAAIDTCIRWYPTGGCSAWGRCQRRLHRRCIPRCAGWFPPASGTPGTAACRHYSPGCSRHSAGAAAQMAAPAAGQTPLPWGRGTDRRTGAAPPYPAK